MAVAVPYVMIAAAAYSAYSQYEAGNEAKELSRYNAEMERKETEETIRRQKLEDRKQEARARASAHAGGTTVSGTVSGYLNRMQETNLDNVSWMRRSGANRASLILKEGSMQRSQARRGAFGTVLGSAGGIYSSGQDADWWN